MKFTTIVCVQYGYTVMHESILWSDVTSLSVMLDRDTARYFDRLPLIVSTSTK